MYIKFLSHGTGDAQRARAYLLQEFDHNGVLRPEVRVLRGNPQVVADLAQSLEFLHKYTSAVIAWHPVDEPTEQDVEAVLDDFERAAFSGMVPDQYAYSAISHGGHVHIFAARVELSTGKSHNMAPPAGKKVFEHLRNHWNFKKGWARPDDPKRARTSQPHPNFSSQLSRVRAVEAEELLSTFSVEPDLSSRDQRHGAVVRWIQQQVLDGTIMSRADILKALGKIGTLNRQSQDYVSVKFDDIPKPIRFKGSLFGAAFDPTMALKMILEPVPSLNLKRDDPDPVRAAEEELAFEQAFLARSKYNASRYKARHLAPPQQGDFGEESEFGLIKLPHFNPKEKSHDGAGNPAVEEVLRICELPKSAIRGLAIACQQAVESTERAGQASRALERASRTYSHAVQRVVDVLRNLKARLTLPRSDGGNSKKANSPLV